MNKTILYTLIFLCIIACKGQEESSFTVENIELEINPQEILNDGDTSKDSLNWNGVYSGVLPCDNCEGIDTYLTLNKDQTYQLKLRYLGTPDKESKEFISEGKFSWDENGII